MKEIQSEIVIYQNQNGNMKIDVHLENEMVWLTQKKMAELLNVGINTINYHIKEIFKFGELEESSTIRKNRIVQKEGNRNVERETDFYNLDMSIDYDLNDEKTIKFIKIVQNKLIWAISKQTVAELVYRRVDASMPLLEMQSFDKRSDVQY